MVMHTGSSTSGLAMAEGKGPILRESADISRLITSHAVNNTADTSRSALHAYEVALKSTRDKCQKQTEQLRQLDDETRQLLADKSGLHAEIEQLRDTVGRQRDRAGQLHRQLATSHRECSALREQVALQSRQLLTARRRLEAAGLEVADLAPASIEQANRGTDELHVQLAVVPPRDSSSSEDISSMTEEEIARRLLELQRAGRRSLQDSFDDVMAGVQRAAAADLERDGGAIGREERQLADKIRRCNQALRDTVTTLLRLKERGAALAMAPHGSLPPLQEIPLSGSPPDHVYAHVLDMTAEEGSNGDEPAETPMLLGQ
ncbi:uncharacterized protein LOC119111660 [Pollicipes pollicipes]|uniref:uncharacterized protein LOC119111660 n=1 Tax=Pollicipes pollicipes TaxID=41117 RepID=UPI0018856EC0|nr:uncharacterized protein LOC119111660 [Pollicipes pollicipes]